MKNIILLFTFLSCFQLIAQQYVVTPSGLRDAKDAEKQYVVIEIDGLSAKQLYDNSIKYINEKYKNPEEVLKGKTDGEYLKFDTYDPNFIIYNNSSYKVPIKANYTTELRFKEGRVRYEIKNLEMKAKSANFYVIFSLNENHPPYTSLFYHYDPSIISRRLYLPGNTCIPCRSQYTAVFE